MSAPMWRASPNPLARARLVLSPGRGRRGWIVWCALVVAAGLAGVAASHLYWREHLGPLQAQVAAAQDMPQLQHGLEQARLQLRLSEARSQELERQIDALNHALRQSQEELAFFRKARDGKH
jgi:uncharacterized protein HemX